MSGQAAGARRGNEGGRLNGAITRLDGVLTIAHVPDSVITAGMESLVPARTKPVVWLVAHILAISCHPQYILLFTTPLAPRERRQSGLERRGQTTLSCAHSARKKNQKNQLL